MLVSDISVFFFLAGRKDVSLVFGVQSQETAAYASTDDQTTLPSQRDNCYHSSKLSGYTCFNTRVSYVLTWALHLLQTHTRLLTNEYDYCT